MGFTLFFILVCQMFSLFLLFRIRQYLHIIAEEVIKISDKEKKENEK